MACDLNNPQLSRNSLIPQAGGVWDYVSPSRLNMWLACPLKFKLKYIEGVPTPTSPAAFLGKLVHQGLEHYYRNRQLNITLAHEEVVGRMLECWPAAADEERMAFETTAAERAMQMQAAALLKGYLLQVQSTCIEPRPLAVEAILEAPLIDLQNGEDLGIPLVGIIDLVLPAEDGALIVDFKTTARNSEPLEVIHEIQLSCYAYLLRHNASAVEGGLEIRSLIKTKTPRIEFHRYAARNAGHLRRLFAVVRAYLDDLDSGRFLFRPGFGCAMCEFRRTCIPHG
jgi:putative RecB family exonuclease